MRFLLLRGIGCDERVFETLNLRGHSVKEIDYLKTMDSKTGSVERLGETITKSLQDTRFDGVIAHSIGGLVGVLMLQKASIHTRFFIALETSFVPAEVQYRTLFHPDTDRALKDELNTMLKSEMPNYPKALKASLRGDFDFEDSLASIDVPVFLLYGKRDMHDKDTLKEKLNLKDETLKTVTLNFIDRAAHFPSLENPVATNKVLKAIFEDFDNDTIQT